jgi:hypothetical protein
MLYAGMGKKGCFGPFSMIPYFTQQLHHLLNICLIPGITVKVFSLDVE